MSFLKVCLLGIKKFCSDSTFKIFRVIFDNLVPPHNYPYFIYDFLQLIENARNFSKLT